MNPKKYVLLSALVAVIILTILFNLGDITSKEIVQYIPPITSQSQTAAVSDFNSSLVAHYTFDDTTNDSAGSNHGTAVGGPTYTTGKIGRGLQFNNDGAFNSPMHVVSSSVSLSSDWSVSFWVLRISNVGAAQYAVSMTDATGILVKDSSGINNWGFFDGTTVLNGSAQIPIQSWTFITVTKSGTTYTLYINGASDTSGTLNDVDISRIMIGVRSSNFLGMHGTLDDVRIYDRALSAGEVSQLHTLGSGGTVIAPDPTPTSQPIPVPDPVVVTPPPVQQQVPPPVVSGSQTYYIDYVSGNNANNGTSKTTPWKVHPFMKGFTGSYSHKAGDRFIFKGGVTWPNSSFQMNITAGGSSDSVRDYYGVDKTWYAGSSWARPVFDFENTLISGGGFNSVGLLINSANYITIDEIDFARYRTPAVGAGDYGSGTLVLIGSSSNITIQNCIVRDWSNGGGADGGSGGGIWSFSSGSGNKVLHCIFHGFNTNIKGGRALSFYGEIGFNEAYDLSTFLMGGGDVHDNYVHNMKGATDPNNHENAFYIMGVSKLYNNLLHDIDPGSSSYYLEPGFSSPSGTTMVYNNVAFNVGNDAPISIETDGQYAASQNIKIFNNTVEHGVGNCIRTVLRGSQHIGSLEVANNHCITTGPAKDFPTATVTTLTDRGTDIVQTHAQAASSGATPTNRYRPTSASSPAINVGLSLPSYFTSDKLGVVRPQSTVWDVGAYEYQGSGTNPPVVTPPITPPVTPPTYKPGDFNRDGAVNALDFSLLSGAWNTNTSTYDLNSDGIVNTLDYVIMVQNWTG